VIEVKDWKLENIRSMDRLTATLQVDGREVRKSNPLEQAKQYAFGVCRLLESDPALVGGPGSSFQGKLVFPWGYGVVLANISRKAFAGTDLGNVIPPERVICQDEMVESVDAEAFQQRLWGKGRAAGGPGALASVSRDSGQPGDFRPGESLRSQSRDGAGYRPGDGSPAGAARKEHGGGPSGDSRRGRLGQDDDPGLPRAVPRAGARQQAHSDSLLQPRACGTHAKGVQRARVA
jgi:hypothetical protein